MADDSRLSSVIDEEGRLFGVINVIDVLVVLLVLAVVGAGLALLVPSDGPADTQYATIDLGPQPEYKADQITEGDRWELVGSGDDLTITEVFASPRTDGERDVVIRVAINGTTLDPETAPNSPVEFAGEPLRFGRQLEIEMPQYVVEGTVTDVSADEQIGAPTTQTVAVQVTDLSSQRAERLAEGMNEVLGDTETATVTDIERESAGDNRQDITLTLTVNTQERDNGAVLFRGERLRLDQSLTLDLDGTIVEGDVIAIQ